MFAQPIVFGDLSTLPSLIQENCPSPSLIFLVLDEKMASLWEEKVKQALSPLQIPVKICFLPPGDIGKDLAGAVHCWDELITAGADRKSLVLALGGGALCDTAAFAAACYMRGIPILHIPTTLLAMVDACIGGKAAINFSGWRNIIGAFHPPIAALIHTGFLSTLPEREFRSGMAEIIKIAYIADSEFFHELGGALPLTTMIKRSIDLKLRIVEQDPHDQGIRSYLNWGHTFGHAIEAVTQYQLYLHGEAVSIGMLAAAALSVILGYLDISVYDQLEKVLIHYQLPTKFPSLDEKELFLAMQKDKKTENHRLSFILSKGIGSLFKKEDVSEEEVRQALQWKKIKDNR